MIMHGCVRIKSDEGKAGCGGGGSGGLGSVIYVYCTMGQCYVVLQQYCILKPRVQISPHISCPHVLYVMIQINDFFQTY